MRGRLEVMLDPGRTGVEKVRVFEHRLVECFEDLSDVGCVRGLEVSKLSVKWEMVVGVVKSICIVGRMDFAFCFNNCERSSENLFAL